MTAVAKTYAVVLIVFLVLDYVWLGIVARNFYAQQLGILMRDNPNFLAAGIFYAFYCAGIVLFAVQPGLSSGSWMMAACLGALLGLLAYGTYDMTNLATLRGWPVLMSIVDMAWGAVLTGIAATAGYVAGRLLG